VRVREIIAECDLPPGVHVRVFTAGIGGRGDRQMKFSVDPPDVSRELRLHYEGFDLVTDVDSAVDLTGVVLDFKDGLDGSGFIFRDSASDSRTQRSDFK
jgi:Fe-S cluster assembly iron-binding protein IscA